MRQAAQIRRDVASAFQPPVKRQVSESAAEFVKIAMPGGYTGPWSSSLTPYLIEPMDTLTSRQHEAVIFVGPAQSGKTEGLILGFIGHVVTACPADMLIIEKSFDAARDFSRRRIDRLIRYSPVLKERLSARRTDDNTYDKFFKNGMILSLGWPAINQLSGRPIRFAALTDYDRMPEDVDNEGDAFGLARKRTTTFMSGGMTLVESSPGNEVLTPDGKPAINWRPTTLHEAPPSPGIIALYNRGDRRCWYWTCPHCQELFRPIFSLLSYPDTGSLKQRAAQAVLPCSHCGAVITHEEKRALNQAGRWLAEWEILGESSSSSNIASFWLEGPAVAFQSWESLVLRYLQAEEEFTRTGDEIPLKSTVNTDQGRPYLSRRVTASRDAAELLDRAEDLPRGRVPEGVRLLLAAIDIQATRFVVQVMGIGVDRESWLIDRFDLALSNRRIGTEPQAVEPATYGEDWELLTDRVITAAYPLADDSGRSLRIRLTGCDSAGLPGVTEQAYEFWRKLKRAGLHSKFLLLKGGESKTAPRVKLAYPDARQRSDRHAQARGDVPVLLLNSNGIKDAVHADLQRSQSGPGYIHLPQWLSASIWDELTAETRTPKGWEKVSARNEAWDLLCYSRALLIYLGADNWGEGWSRCPPWAREWEINPLVIQTESVQPTPSVDTPTAAPRATNPWIRRNNKPWIR